MILNALATLATFATLAAMFAACIIDH